MQRSCVLDDECYQTGLEKLDSGGNKKVDNSGKLLSSSTDELNDSFV